MRYSMVLSTIDACRRPLKFRADVLYKFYLGTVNEIKKIRWRWVFVSCISSINNARFLLAKIYMYVYINDFCYEPRFFQTEVHKIKYIYQNDRNKRVNCRNDFLQRHSVCIGNLYGIKSTTLALKVNLLNFRTAFNMYGVIFIRSLIFCRFGSYCTSLMRIII